MSDMKRGWGTWFLGFAILAAAGVYFVTGTEQGKQLFRRMTGPPASKDETLAYWNKIRSLYFETALANASDKNIDFGKAAASLRQVAKQIDELPTRGVDYEAVECGKEMSDLLIKGAAAFDKMPTGATGIVTILHALVDWKGALGDAIVELKALREQSEKAEAKARRVRAALSSRYGVEFPRLLPPVGVVLVPYNFEKGYYVVLQNTSTVDTVSAKLTYTDAAGQTWTQNATVPASGMVQLDPDDVGLRINFGMKVKVETDGYSHTYETDRLIPR
jgi:hypothetical protein